MKLVRYGPQGREKPGMIDADGRLRDLSAQVADIGGDTLSPAALDRLRAIDPTRLPAVDGSPRLGVPISPISKVVGVGMNYRDHAAKAQVPLPAQPVLFIKPSTTVAGPFDDTVIPAGATKLDWEVEFGIVIGSVARNVTAADAMRHVAGYVVVDDLTERGWIVETGQLTDGKSADGLTPIGPWLVTADEVGDWTALSLTLSVNGLLRQTGRSDDLIFAVPELIARISSRMTLLPGDVVSTGTPWGIGHRMQPPVYLRDGDRIELAVTGLGSQSRRIRAG